MSVGVPFRSAGKLGDYQCDLPVWTYHSMLSNIKETHPDIDYIFSLEISLLMIRGGKIEVEISKVSTM